MGRGVDDATAEAERGCYGGNGIGEEGESRSVQSYFLLERAIGSVTH